MNGHIFFRKLRYSEYIYWIINKKSCSLIQHIWRLLWSEAASNQLNLSVTGKWMKRLKRIFQ